MHWEADDAFGHAVGSGEVGRVGGFQSTVGAELADEGVEVSSAKDVVALHEGVELVAGGAVGLGIDEDGEVTVVVPDAGHVLEEGDAGDAAQGLTVGVGYFLAGGDGGIDLSEVQYAVGGSHLVHLGVDSGTYDGGLAGKAEVLEVIYAAFSLFVVHDHGATFDSVVDFGGVEAQGGEVSCIQNTFPIDFNTKNVGSVVDNLEAVGVGYLLDAANVAGLAVAVNGHYSRGLGGNGGFDLVGVEVAGLGVDIDEYGLAAIPPDAVGGGDKGVRGGDYFACDVQGLQGCEQRQGSVCEEADVGHSQILGEFFLELAMELAVVGYPLAVPYLL